MKKKYSVSIKQKNFLLILIFMTVLLSFPGYVKTELMDSIATMLLVLIIGVFLCAGIGWFAKRNDSNKY